jgi:hypothetical protein
MIKRTQEKPEYEIENDEEKAARIYWEGDDILCVIVEKGETHFYITLKELRELLETAERDREEFLGIGKAVMNSNECEPVSFRGGFRPKGI